MAMILEIAFLMLIAYSGFLIAVLLTLLILAPIAYFETEAEAAEPIRQRRGPRRRLDF